MLRIGRKIPIDQLSADRYRLEAQATGSKGKHGLEESRFRGQMNQVKQRREAYDVEWVPVSAAQRSYSALAFSVSPRLR